MEKRYSREDNHFSYKNCVIAESGGEVAGMIAAFPMIEPDQNVLHTEMDPVLIPYSKLEQYNSYYIAGMAVNPEYRGKGIGTKLLNISAEKSTSLDLPQLSLIVFEQNEGAKRLYERHGFYEINREMVVPHELIHHTVDAILIVKDIK
ncbi:MAG: GNAT family N-acetyltransferase [Thermodesulfobacteriota bacterium]